MKREILHKLLEFDEEGYATNKVVFVKNGAYYGVCEEDHVMYITKLRAKSNHPWHSRNRRYYDDITKDKFDNRIAEFNYSDICCVCPRFGA